MRFSAVVAASLLAVAAVADARAVALNKAQSAAVAALDSSLHSCNSFDFPADLDYRNLGSASYIYPDEDDKIEGDDKDCSKSGECSTYRIRLPLALMKARGFSYFRVRQSCDRGNDYTHNNSEVYPIKTEETVVQTARCKKPAWNQSKSVPYEIVIHFFTSRGFYGPRWDLPQIFLVRDNSEKYWDGTVSVYEYGQKTCPAL